MNVADAMTPRSEVITVEIPGMREDVLEYLQDRGFSSVPVIRSTDDGEQFRGLVTRESLIEQPDEDQLALLKREVPSVGRSASMTELAELVLESGERRVPVVEDGELLGIVTVTDIVRAIAEGEQDGDTTVDALATREVNTVYHATPLPVAEREISYANVPYAVVLDDDGRQTGMVTEVDIIEVARVVQGESNPGDAVANQDDEWMWEGIKAVGSRSIPTLNVEIPSTAVSEFMTEDLVTVSRTRSARDAAQLMLSNDIEQIPLLSGDELIGIVRDIDLLEALV
ncbi:MAG: CBS domain-containing protein [Natronomonas sp.]|jgi:CBS domain-containing protein|uniref:CBS domain-containing protein n=1 Tax=Natronomonas sp. TaxID=2184060 RepID=UPI00286FDE2B|nr:CBS domain-containing protein [Natronomonas sp.]MDR9380849.1 CBS domain-containing protein [Natronomonas sp.]MDR9430087.1 CBS domain-containing protein [Natronomonas sp.]